MTNGRLVYTSDPQELIRKAREVGLSTYNIVVQLAQGRTYKETVPIARKYHPILEITYGEFMKMARGRSW